MRWLAVAATAAGILATGVAGAGGALDPRLVTARFAAVGFDVGTRILPESDVSPEVLPEEREAAQRIRKAIEAWGKYKIEDRPSRADITIVLRKGRLGSVGGGARVGGPSTGPAGAGPQGHSGAYQLSSPDDMLEVFGPQGERLWRASRARGLDGEVPPLFEALRREVRKAEAAAKKP